MEGTQASIRAARSEDNCTNHERSAQASRISCDGNPRRGQMNKLELVEHVAKEAELSKASAAAALDAILDGIGKSLKKGDEVRLVGFGTFSVRERAAGKGRNPA